MKNLYLFRNNEKFTIVEIIIYIYIQLYYSILYTVYTIYDEYLDLYIWFFINKQLIWFIKQIYIFLKILFKEINIILWFSNYYKFFKNDKFVNIESKKN